MAKSWHGTCIIKGGVETRRVVTDEAETFDRKSVDVQKQDHCGCSR
ncbi:hypothetical protein STFR1_20506 [Bacillus vallismortis]